MEPARKVLTAQCMKQTLNHIHGEWCVIKEVDREHRCREMSPVLESTGEILF